VTIAVRWIHSLAELRALGQRYDRMVLDAGPAGLFYQLGWIERAWPYFHIKLGGSLAFLVATRGAEIVGVAPLALRNKDWAHAKQRVLQVVGGTNDELDNWVPEILTAGVDRAECMRALGDGIAASSWDLLELRLLRDETAGLIGASFPGISSVVDPLATPRVALDGGWAEYRAKLPKRLTRMLDRGHKRAREEGVTVVHEVTTGVPAERRADAELLHRARQDQIRQSGRARSSPFDEPASRAVFWRLMDWATEQGHLRAHWMSVGGKLAAFILALHHAGTTYAYFNAIDPAADRFSPGNLVLAAMIEREATDHGAKIVDLMAGANLTKSLFATEEVTNRDLAMVNPARVIARAKDGWIRGAKALMAARKAR